MKLKCLIRILIIAVFSFIMLNLVFLTKSNAAIQIKAGTGAHKSISVNNAFQYCYDLRYPSSTLGNNNLDPHLATALDWGIGSYLGLSGYGAATRNEGSASQITIGDASYWSLTGNKTGLMNWGANFTYTATTTQDSSSNGDRSKLYETANSKYVTVLPSSANSENTKGMAISETASIYSTTRTYVHSTVPILFRIGINGYNRNYGAADGNVTYRPAIWN